MAVEGSGIARSISVAFELHGNGSGHVISELRQNPATQPAAPPSPAPTERKPRKPPDLDRIAGLYKVEPAAAQPWKRMFLGRTPDDVGGIGQVARFKADIGNAWTYLERFRGDRSSSAMRAAALAHATSSRRGCMWPREVRPARGPSRPPEAAVQARALALVGRWAGPRLVSR